MAYLPIAAPTAASAGEWECCAPACPKASAAMDKFIHRENLALFRKRLEQAPDDATRQVLLKLLAEEEAKEPSSPPKSKS